MTKKGLVSGIASLGAPTRGSFFRAVPLVYIHTPLSAIGSLTNGGRYNPIGAFEVFYAAQERDTVPRETRAIIVDPVSGATLMGLLRRPVLTEERRRERRWRSTIFRTAR